MSAPLPKATAERVALEMGEATYRDGARLVRLTLSPVHGRLVRTDAGPAPVSEVEIAEEDDFAVLHHPGGWAQ